jgi:hypothetical protein
MILGILASSQPAAAGDYESIATVTVGSGGAANVEFTSIPSTYVHLEIRFIGRSTTSSIYSQSIYVAVNSDTATNYSRHYLGAYTGGYAATAAGGDVNQTYISLPNCISSNAYDNSMFGAGSISILDYQNTNKYKTVRMLGGAEANSSTNVSTIFFSSGLWRSTSAITSIKLTPSNGDFMQYSHFALYGIKSA